MKNLVLDHIYYSLNDDEFFKNLTHFDLNNHTVHKKVVTDIDSWEGLYVFAKNRTYFEFLRERRLGGLGVAFQDITSVEVGVPETVEKSPHLNWKTGSRFYEDGTLWFRWYSLKNYLDLHLPFSFWIMQYPELVMRKRISQDRDGSDYSNIGSIHLESPTHLQEEFEESIGFLKSITSRSQDLTEISLGSATITVRWVEMTTSNLPELKFALGRTF